MRIMLKRRIYWFAGVLTVILIFHFLRNTFSNFEAESDIPLLRKSYLRKSNVTLIGPFRSDNVAHASDHDVTLVTHTSLSNLYRLQIIGLVWSAPISVAVWANGDITGLVEMAYLLTQKCYLDRSISISIIVPGSNNYYVDVESINWKMILNPDAHVCTQRHLHNQLYKLRSLDKAQNYDKKFPYPNNKLRNLALSSVSTQYVLVADIDLLPSMHMHTNIIKMVHAKPMADNMAFVVPVFECEDSHTNQWTIEKLVKGLKAGNVRQFYAETCPQCQGPTQYTNWLERQAQPNLNVHKPVPLAYKPGWEPFVVLKASRHPRYDERFLQFGYNRLSLICELHMSGFKFHVMDKVFLMHDGFKTEEGFHAEKDREQKRNERLFMEFRNELARKLNTKRTC